MKLQLGQQITFDTIYLRYSKMEPSRYNTWSKTRYKFWKKYPCKQQGIIVGVRTLSNGESHYDSDEGHYYVRRESVEVVLVATTLRRSILKVPLEDIVLEDLF